MDLISSLTKYMYNYIIISAQCKREHKGFKVAITFDTIVQF